MCLSFFALAAPQLMASVQQNQKKVANALLKKAKDFCTEHEVYTFN